MITCYIILYCTYTQTHTHIEIRTGAQGYYRNNKNYCLVYYSVWLIRMHTQFNSIRHQQVSITRYTLQILESIKIFKIDMIQCVLLLLSKQNCNYKGKVFVFKILLHTIPGEQIGRVGAKTKLNHLPY